MPSNKGKVQPVSRVCRLRPERSAYGIAAVALVLASLGLTACSSGSGDDASELTIMGEPSSKEAMDELVAEFEKESGIDVRVDYPAPGVDKVTAQLRTQLSAGTAPDVFLALPGGTGKPIAVGSLFAGDHIEDLSAEEWADKIPANVRPHLEADGKLGAFPGPLMGISSIYDLDALDELGIEPPRTFDEVLQLCAKAADAGKTAFAYGGQDSWVNSLTGYAMASELIYTPDPDFPAKHDAGEVSFSDEPWMQLFEQTAEMVDAGCYQESPLGTSYTDALASVAAGDALGIISIGKAIGALEAANPEGRYTLTAFPATNSPDTAAFTAGVGLGFAINSKSDMKEEAKEFLDFYASDDVQAEFNEQVGGVVPPIEIDGFETPDSLTEFASYVERGAFTVNPANFWPNPEVEQTFLLANQDLVLGDKTPAEVAAELDEVYKHP